LPPRDHADILDRLRALLPELHSAEHEAARLILEDADWVTDNSIKTLATRAGVSEPTVMRLCRKLDCAGFSDFKIKLAQDLTLTRVFEEAGRAATAPDTLSGAVLEAASRAMNRVADRLDQGTLERAAEHVAAARMIYCFGVGGSSAVLAAELENRLFRLKKPAQATCDPYRQRMVASIADAHDVILCLSATGKPTSMVDAAALATSNEAVVVSVTEANSPLAEVSTHTLAVGVHDDEIYFGMPTSMRYAQLFTIDSLMATVATKLPDSATHLRDIRRTLAALHGPSRLQPIGD